MTDETTRHKRRQARRQAIDLRQARTLKRGGWRSAAARTTWQAAA